MRPQSWAEEWSGLGHDVTVVTTEKKHDEKTSLKFDSSSYELIEISLPSIFSRSKESYHQSASKKGGRAFLYRGIYWFRERFGVFNACRFPDITEWWVKSAIKAVGNKEYDLVVSTAGPYTVHRVGHALKKKGIAKKWIADFRDKWTGHHLYPGLFPFTLYEKYLEKKLLSFANLITVVSAPFGREFRQLFGSNRVKVVPNGCDPSHFHHLKEGSPFPDDGKYRIVHTGSLYPNCSDPKPLFQAIHELKTSIGDQLEVHFVGPNTKILEPMIENLGIEKWVKLGGFVSRDMALAMQKAAHTLLFLPLSDPKCDGVLTGKIYEYLCSKSRIIAVGANQLEESQRLIIDSKAGSALHSVEEIRKFLLDELPENKKILSGITEETINRYDRRFLARELLRLSTDPLISD